MFFISQVPDISNSQAMDVLQELSPWAYVVTAMALSIATLFIYLYLKEKGAHESTKDEYLSYAKETVAEQISVSKDVIDLVKNSTGRLNERSVDTNKVLETISKTIADVTNQLQKIETLITRND